MFMPANTLVKPCGPVKVTVVWSSANAIDSQKVGPAQADRIRRHAEVPRAGESQRGAGVEGDVRVDPVALRGRAGGGGRRRSPDTPSGAEGRHDSGTPLPVVTSAKAVNWGAADSEEAKTVVAAMTNSPHLKRWEGRMNTSSMVLLWHRA